jgi:hypothetical protein
MNHYHSCPECYEKYSCDMDCTIEPDLEDPIAHPGKQFGSHCECASCQKLERDSHGTVLYSKEWWDRYHGFIR